MRFNRRDINLSQTRRQASSGFHRPCFECAVARVAALPRAVWSSELRLAAPGTILGSAASEAPRPTKWGVFNARSQIEQGSAGSRRSGPCPGTVLTGGRGTGIQRSPLTFCAGLPFLSVRASTNRCWRRAYQIAAVASRRRAFKRVCWFGTACFNRTLARAAILVRVLLNERR